MKATSAPKPPTIWSLPFILLLLTNILYSLNFNMVQPVVPIFAKSLGANDTLMGLSSGLFAVSALAMRPITSPAADRFNNRRILLASLFIFATSTLGYALSKNIYFLLFFRILHGIGLSFCSTVTMKLAGDCLPAERMGTGIGVYGLAAVISMAIAPYIGLLLTDLMGYVGMFIFGACLTLTAVPMACLLRIPAREKPMTSVRHHFSITSFIAPKAVAPAVIILLFGFAYSAIGSFVAVYGKSLGVADIGLFFTVYGFAMLLTRPVIGRLSDYRGIMALIYPCAAAFTGAMVLIAFARTLTVFLAAALLLSIGFGGMQPAIQALCIRLCPASVRGVASGTYFMGLDAGTGIGPIIAGMVAGYLGYPGMFLVFIVPIVAAAVFATFNRKRLIIPEEKHEPASDATAA